MSFLKSRHSGGLQTTQLKALHFRVGCLPVGDLVVEARHQAQKGETVNAYQSMSISSARHVMQEVQRQNHQDIQSLLQSL